MTLPSPNETGEPLSAFPDARIRAGRVLFRIARSGHHPWWFGCSMAGRFDLSSPHGTCYLAEDPVGALLEILGHGRRGGLVSAALLDDRRLFGHTVDRAWRVADMTDRVAFRFGITSEIGTLVPYRIPQAWAASFHAEGFDGVRYGLRHDPARSAGVARFGRAGTREDWPVDRAEPISRVLRREIEDVAGIVVAEIPRANQLRFSDRPR